MEIRARYMLVGLFTLLMIFGGLGFTLWVAKKDTGVGLVQYDITITESVAGLALNSDVLFSGIKVGTVTQIKVSETTPGAVRARISIAADTPVREDSEASLEFRGMTGVSLITVSGGTAVSPINRPEEDQIGTIKYKPSPFASVLANVPSAVEITNQVLLDLSRLLSKENIDNLGTTIQSLATLTSSLADRTETLNAILNNAETASADIAGMAKTMNRTLMHDITKTTASVNSMAERLDKMVVTMEPGLRQLSQEGITEMRMLVVESRNLIHVLTRIGQKLESDPRAFLFGETRKEYKAQ